MAATPHPSTKTAAPRWRHGRTPVTSTSGSGRFTPTATAPSTTNGSSSTTTPTAPPTWTISTSENDAGHTYHFEDAYTFTADGTCQLHTGDGDSDSMDGDIYWDSSTMIWNNSGDTVYLYDDDGTLHDSKATESGLTTSPSGGSPFLSAAAAATGRAHAPRLANVPAVPTAGRCAAGYPFGRPRGPFFIMIITQQSRSCLSYWHYAAGAAFNLGCSCFPLSSYSSQLPPRFLRYSFCHVSRTGWHALRHSLRHLCY